MAEATATLLPFSLGDTTCALPVERIATVLEAPRITPIPKAPPAVEGVINLRGNIVPVIDLERLFGMAPVEGRPGAGAGRSVVVAETGEGRYASLFGLAVDAIRKVTQLPAAEVSREVPPGLPVPRDFISGIARMRDEYFIVLDAKTVFALESIFARNPGRGDKR